MTSCIYALQRPKPTMVEPQSPTTIAQLHQHYNRKLLTTLSSPSTSPLLALPAELRNSIWTQLLVVLPSQPRDAKVKSHLHPALLRVNRQINTEATPILYGANTFTASASLLTGLPSLLTSSRDLRPPLFPPIVHPRVTALIRKWFLRVRLDTDPRFDRVQAAEAFSGVEELEIEAFQAMFSSSDYAVLELFEGVRGVGKARVLGSVGDGKYAEWLASCMMLPAGTEVGSYYRKQSAEQYPGNRHYQEEKVVRLASSYMSTMSDSTPHRNSGIFGPTAIGDATC